MARKKKGKRSHPVPVKSTRGSNHVGTITVEDQLKMERAARRQGQIESGLNPASGAGVHGGNKRQKRRKDRQESKRKLRDLG